MGIFKNYKMKDVKVFGKGRYFKDGEYIVRLENVKFNDGYKGESFIIEAEVLAVQTSEDDAPITGQLASQVIKLGGADQMKSDMGLSDMKAFVCAACEMDVDDTGLDDEGWDELLTGIVTDNTLKDTVVRLSCYSIQTKAGNPFTVHRWIGIATPEDLEKFGI